MLSRTEKISGFHLKVSRHERELYEEFCNSAEAELLKEMRAYFTEAKQKSGVINFDRLGLWAKIQDRIDHWLREACIWKHLNPSQVPRAREAIKGSSGQDHQRNAGWRRDALIETIRRFSP
jgi:hypothetical protein